MQTTHRVRSMWFVAVLGIVGCASAPAPEWLEGRHEGFPEDRWVVSVGAGPNDTEAAAQAREKITLDTQGESEGIGIAETWTDTTSGTHWAMAVLDRKALLDRQRRGDHPRDGAHLRLGPPKPVGIHHQQPHRPGGTGHAGHVALHGE